MFTASLGNFVRITLKSEKEDFSVCTCLVCPKPWVPSPASKEKQRVKKKIITVFQEHHLTIKVSESHEGRKILYVTIIQTTNSKIRLFKCFYKV